MFRFNTHLSIPRCWKPCKLETRAFHVLSFISKHLECKNNSRLVTTICLFAYQSFMIHYTLYTHVTMLHTFWSTLQLLETLKPKFPDSSFETAKLPENQIKNRDMAIIPGKWRAFARNKCDTVMLCPAHPCFVCKRKKCQSCGDMAFQFKHVHAWMTKYLLCWIILIFTADGGYVQLQKTKWAQSDYINAVFVDVSTKNVQMDSTGI